MPPLTADRNTPRRENEDLSHPAAAGAVIFAGALVQLNAAGDAVAASATAANITAGVAQANVDNTGGAAGAKKVPVRHGCFRFANSAAGDLIARPEIGDNCYVVDDQTVAKTNNAGARPVAGVIADVDAAGVWVNV